MQAAEVQSLGSFPWTMQPEAERLPTQQWLTQTADLLCKRCQRLRALGRVITKVAARRNQAQRDEVVVTAGSGAFSLTSAR